MRSTICFLFLSVLAAGVVGIVPRGAYASTHARTTEVIVKRVLPPHTQGCPTLGVSDIHPYLYDGALHSFDLSITDPSYVAIGGKVGDVPVSFQQMTRWHAADGSLRIHVDVATADLHKAVPVTIALLSSYTGEQPMTCVAVVSSTIAPVSGTTIAKPVALEQPYAGHALSKTPIVKIKKSITFKEEHTVRVIGGRYSHNLSALGAALRLSNMGHALGDICANHTGAVRLWFVLVVLYAIFTAILLSQKDEMSDIKSSRDWYVTLIMGIFVVLLFFWYLFAPCRTGSWVPVLTTLVAVAGLTALVYRRDEKESVIPLLKSAYESK